MKSGMTVILFLLVCLAAAEGNGTTRIVGPGQEYSTIQAAIDDSAPGDVVQVLPGEYIENIVLKEGVDVIGSGADTCIIRSISESFLSTTVEARGDLTLSGFTIAGGYTGIQCVAVSPTILDCVVSQNASYGILMEGASPVISRSVIARNALYGIRCLDSSAPTISNCTVSANGCGVSSDSSSPVLSNCILWENGDDLEGVTDGAAVMYCDIEDGDFPGENGNISADPCFVAWGSFNKTDNPLYVDLSHLGPEAGTKDLPFREMGSALSVYSYHLGTGSPCLNAGQGNVHMGAYPDEEPAQPPGSKNVVVNVAAGTYHESRIFVCHGAEVRGPTAPPVSIIAFGDTGFYLLGQSCVRNFSIAGADDAIACFFAQTEISGCVILECGQNAIYSVSSDTTIQGCYTFYNAGAGALLEGGQGLISDCFFGSHVTAGVVCSGGASATVRNCLMTESPFGVICDEGSVLQLHNCTVSANTLKGAESRSGASVSILNSIVWENAFAELSQEGGTIDAAYSNIAGGFPGEDNLSQSPLFEKGPLGNFYLDSDSPCIDKGNDTAENLGLGAKTVSPRGAPDSGIVDLGYHYEKFQIRRVTAQDGQVTLEWQSAPRMDYTVRRASSVSTPAPWETVAAVNATWIQESLTLDLPPEPAEFYRVGQP
jgi:parallel beta-helix repeat protein